MLRKGEIIMKKETVLFNKGVVSISIVLFVFSLILFIAIGCTSKDLETFIALLILFVVCFIFALIITNWRIEVYEDKLIKCTLFSKKQFMFNKITMLKEVVVTRVFDIDGKELFRIDNFNDKNSVIYKYYCNYVRKNKIDISYKNINTISFSFATKGFSIFWMIMAVILFAFSAFSYFVFGISLLEDKIAVIFTLSLGSLCLIASLWGLLKYYNYSIRFNEEDRTLEITNMYKIRKVYILDECSYEYNGILVKLYVNGKKIKTYSYYFMSNFHPLLSVLKEKDER